MHDSPLEISSPPSPRLDLVAIEMGYGHLRPAHSLQSLLGNTEILLADAAPLAPPLEERTWRRVRQLYELLSRTSRTPLVGRYLGDLLDGITSIPSLYPRRDLSQPTVGVQILHQLARQGLGRGLAERLRQEERSLLTTFYGPAILSDYHGARSIHCVVTDADVNRIWAPLQPRTTSIQYYAPSQRVRRRLKAYGVPAENIRVTGFPLPHELIGGPEAPLLRENLKRRLVRLDPKGRFLRDVRDEISHFLGELPPANSEPPHLVFAVGGAGAQAEMVDEFLPSLVRKIRKAKLRLTLVAGIRPEIAQQFQTAIQRCNLEEEQKQGLVRILLAPHYADYFTQFNELLQDADILWTKPSELCFYGALGLPLLFAPPVGSHERYNRRWMIDSGAGIKQFRLAHTGEWLGELLKDGTLAGAAWNGYRRMPVFGLYRILEEVVGREYLEQQLASHSSHTTELEQFAL